MSTVANRIKNVPTKKSNGRKNGSNGHATNGHSATPDAALQRPSDSEIESMAKQYEKLQNEASAMYKQADLLEEKLISVLAGGLSPMEAMLAFGRGETKQIIMSDGRLLKLKSKFYDAGGTAKFKAYSPAGIQPVEVEIK